MAEKRTALAAQTVVYRRQPGGSILVLLLYKSKQDASWWQSPRGGIEKDESPADAALRETSEETGIEKPLAFYDLDYNYQFEYTVKDPETGRPVMTTVTDYCFAIETDREAIVLSDEHIDYRWVTPEEAMETFDFEGNREAVRRLRALLNDIEPKV